MDSKLKKLITDQDISGGGEHCIEQGFVFAIERLRENEYYGHYAQFLAQWLEDHLIKEVS